MKTPGRFATPRPFSRGQFIHKGATSPVAALAIPSLSRFAIENHASAMLSSLESFKAFFDLNLAPRHVVKARDCLGTVTRRLPAGNPMLMSTLEVL